MSAPRPQLSRLSEGPRPPLTRLDRVLGVAGYFATVSLRTWRSWVVSRFVQPVFFVLAMGVGVGGLVDRSSGGVGGVPYLSYVAPGLLMASVMQWATSESTWPVMTLLKWNQLYVAMLAAPNRVGDLILGHWLVICTGIAGGAAVFVGVTGALGAVVSWWSLLAILWAVLLALAFITPLFWVASVATNEEHFSTIFRLVVTPLMLFSGTFFPISQLPTVLQVIAWATPLSHGTELARAAFLGAPLPPGWAGHVTVLVLYAVAGAVFARRALARRLET